MPEPKLEELSFAEMSYESTRDKLATVSSVIDGMPERHIKKPKKHVEVKKVEEKVAKP